MRCILENVCFFVNFDEYIRKNAYCGAGIAERVSALDWLSLRYAAIITLPVSNPGLCS